MNNDLETKVIKATEDFTNNLFNSIVEDFKPVLQNYNDKIIEIVGNHSVNIIKKRSREPTPVLDPEEKQEKKDVSQSSSSSSSSESPVLSSKKKKQKEDEQKDQKHEVFECAGTIWKTPIIPCKKGKKSFIKEGIQIIDENGNKKKYTICRDCKNIRIAEKRAEKRAKIKDETKNK